MVAGGEFRPRARGGRGCEVIDVPVDDAQGAANAGRRGDVLAGHEQVEEVVVHLDAEDAERLPVAGEPAGAGARSAGDEAVAG